jgi:hypothetical protein
MRNGFYARKSPDPSSRLACVPAEGQIPLMNLSNYLTMDPHLLLGLLNTELRNHCDSIDDLVKTHHLDEERLIEKMAAADYVYQPELNQFR